MVNHGLNATVNVNNMQSLMTKWTDGEVGKCLELLDVDVLHGGGHQLAGQLLIADKAQGREQEPEAQDEQPWLHPGHEGHFVGGRPI